MIGPTERAILRTLRKGGPGIVREIRSRLNETGQELAYTSVATTLERLFKKGLVVRSEEPFRGSKRYRYRLVTPEGSNYEGFLKQILQIFGREGLVHFIEHAQGLTKEEIDQLEAHGK